MSKKVYQIVEYIPTDKEPAEYESYDAANRNRKAMEVIHALDEVIFIIEEKVVGEDQWVI